MEGGGAFQTSHAEPWFVRAERVGQRRKWCDGTEMVGLSVPSASCPIAAEQVEKTNIQLHLLLPLSYAWP